MRRKCRVVGLFVAFACSQILEACSSDGCENGYKDYGDGECRLIEPCSPNPCTEDYKKQCTNNQGVAVCSCDPNYEFSDQDKCVRYEYQCSDTDVCGANAMRRECQGDTCSIWAVLDECEVDQICWSSQDGSGCSTCEFGCLHGVCNACALGSGPCCDDQGQIKPDTAVCQTGTSYQCAGSDCGNDVQKQTWTKYCDGQTSTCTSEPILDDWEIETDCEVTALCLEQQDATPICSPCEHGCQAGICNACTPGSGPCCDDAGHFKTTDTQCNEWTEYRCSNVQCGATTQSRVVMQNCTGDNAQCVGETTDPFWNDIESCDGTSQECATDGTSYVQCTNCMENSSCTAGACTCDFQTCFEVCCADGQVCHWSQTCGPGENKITASDAQAGDIFGSSVSISGQVAIVGAPNEDGAIGDPEIPWDGLGAAYSFNYENGHWTEKQKLVASDAQPSDKFGYAVSISGDKAIIGAYCEDGTIGDGLDPYDCPGAAYIFTYNNGQWSETKKLTASDTQIGDLFGIAVSISQDTAVIGAPGVNYGGAVYIFQLENQSWIEKKKLVPVDSNAGDLFGSSVSISGDIIIVGATTKDVGGSAYIYQREDLAWVEKQQLTASDVQADDWFGCAVSISGLVAIIGAYNENGGVGDPIYHTGAAYIFAFEDGQWVAKKKLTASDAQTWALFGYSVSISGNFAIVGAKGDPGTIGDPGDPYNGPGAAYIYQSNNGEWIESAKLTASDQQIPDSFGYSVSIDGQTAIVGSYFEDGGEGDPIINAGAAYIY